MFVSHHPLFEIDRSFKHLLVLGVGERPMGAETVGDLRQLEGDLHRVGQAEHLHGDRESLLGILDPLEN